MNEETIADIFAIEEIDNDIHYSYSWEVEPSIKAEDILVVDYNETKKKHSSLNECAYVFEGGKYGIILYDGTYIVEPQNSKYADYALSLGRLQVGSTTVEGGDELTVQTDTGPGRGWSDEYYYYDEEYEKLYWCYSPPMSNYHIYDSTNNSYENSIGKDYRAIIACRKAKFNYSDNGHKVESDSVGVKWGAANKYGDIIADFIYDDVMVRDYSYADTDTKPVAALKKGDKWCYIDKWGNQIIDFVVNGVTYLSTGYGKDHLMECNDAEELYPYLPTEGFIAINSDSGAGFYTANGNEAIPVGTFEETRPVHNSLAWVKDKNTGLWGVIKVSSDKVKITDSGECGAEGDNVKWELYENGTLRIYGNGDMKNYTSSVYNLPPWYGKKISLIKEVIIEDGVTSIGDKVFNGCSLTEITIPDGVKSIGKGAFMSCKGLIKITIPDSMTSIERNVFFSCTGLTEITIPDSITSIENGAFAGCLSLTDVYYTGTEEDWNEILIDLSAVNGNHNLCDATIHYNNTGDLTKPGTTTTPDFDKKAGDANDDDIVNIKDVILVRRYILSPDENPINQTNADMNDDGIVNIKDVIFIRRYILNNN